MVALVNTSFLIKLNNSSAIAVNCAEDSWIVHDANIDTILHKGVILSEKEFNALIKKYDLNDTPKKERIIRKTFEENI